MESEIRNQKLSLIEYLQKYSKQFSFEMAAYILEHGSAVSFGKEIDTVNVPFKTQSINSFHLRGTEIEKIVEINGAKTVYIERLSISGLNAPLPTPYAELIFRRDQEQDAAMAAFINAFNMRLLGISYQISKRRYLSLQRHKNVNCMLSRTISAFFGDSPETMDRKISRLSYLFWTKEKSTAGLEAIIVAAFGFKVRVEEFQTFWANRRERFYLGDIKLGKNSELGTKASISSFGIKIELNHNFSKIYQLLTNNEYLQSLTSLIRKYLGEFFSCFLYITPEEAPPLVINNAVLGKTAWIPGKNFDPAKIVL
ncbi:MAG: type VI secretion system baseplate subunit TssG [Holosporaceae bacterium]|jgi:type VI secretion system protein ImpH|nr:type VI secretion system baseplate subunit TssG [Holosporaceae bacterium]